MQSYSEVYYLKLPYVGKMLARIKMKVYRIYKQYWKERSNIEQVETDLGLLQHPRRSSL